MVHSYLLRYFHYTEDNEEYERGKSFAAFNCYSLRCFLYVRRLRGAQCKCSTKRAIVVRKTKGRQWRAFGCAEFLESKYVREGSVRTRLSVRLLYGRQRGSTGMSHEVRNSWGGSRRR